MTQSTALDTTSLQKPFQAEWPDALNPSLKSLCTKILKVFWEILSVIIFPIGLVRLGFYCLRKYLIRQVIVPGVVGDHSYDRQWIRDYSGEIISLKSPDGATFDGVFFKGNTEPKKVIIYAFGNGVCWEYCESDVELLQKTGASIMMINPRKDCSDPDDLALDIYTAFQYLMKVKDMDPDDILPIGHSMGAAYAVRGAALVQEQYPDKKIKAVSKNSFSKLSTESHFFVKKFGKYAVGDGCFGKFLTTVSSCLAPALVKLIGLEMDSKAAWDQLKGPKCVISCKTDHLIPDEASLYQAIKKDTTQDVFSMRMFPDPDQIVDSHNRHLDEVEEIVFLNQIKKLLNLKKTFAFLVAPDRFPKTKQLKVISAA